MEGKDTDWKEDSTTSLRFSSQVLAAGSLITLSNNTEINVVKWWWSSYPGRESTASWKVPAPSQSNCSVLKTKIILTEACSHKSTSSDSFYFIRFCFFLFFFFSDAKTWWHTGTISKWTDVRIIEVHWSTLHSFGLLVVYFRICM